MKLIIEMPEEFEIHFMQDKFEGPCNTENFRSRTAMHVENFAEQNV